MVEISRDIDSVQYRFVLRPNRSLSWRGSLIFFYSLCLISAAISAGMAWLGLWLVLPFAGLEMLLLGCGLYIVAQRCHECEIIRIDSDHIRIEKGRTGPRRQWRLPRLWAQVVLERCPRQWYPSRLLIRSHGRDVEIGKFLNEEERQRLAVELHRAL